MTVPTQLAVIPQYLIISSLGWVDTLQALIVPGLASAFGIFWMRQHLSSALSDELMQAARIDGAGSWQIFWRIAFPLVRPAAFVLGLFGFVTGWNDFLWPFIVLKSPEMYTVQIAFKALQSNRDIDLGLAMSGSFLATIPLQVLFAFVDRRMVAGIMDGAFKGQSGPCAARSRWPGWCGRRRASAPARRACRPRPRTRRGSRRPRPAGP